MIRGSAPSVPTDSDLNQLPAEEVARRVESGAADAELAALAVSPWPEVREAAQGRARALRQGL